MTAKLSNIPLETGNSHREVATQHPMTVPISSMRLLVRFPDANRCSAFCTFGVGDATIVSSRTQARPALPHRRQGAVPEYLGPAGRGKKRDGTGGAAALVKVAV